MQKNPIFPFYNKIFQSPLYELKNFRDERWGPKSFGEVLVYNIICLKDKSRNSEWGLFSYRLLAEYFIIAGCLAFLFFKGFRRRIGKYKMLLTLSVLALICNYSLLATTGYYRYGVLIEILFGLVIVLCLYILYLHKLTLSFAILFCLCVTQVSTVVHDIYINEKNLSWYDYSAMKQVNGMADRETNLLLKDMFAYEAKLDSSLNIRGFLSSERNGYLKVLSYNTPIYNLTAIPSRQAEVDSFAKKVVYPISRKKGLFTIAIKEAVLEKIKELNSRNFLVDSIVNLYPNFRSFNDPLYLLRIKSLPEDQKIVNVTSILRNDSTGISDDFHRVSDVSGIFLLLRDPFTLNWPKATDSFRFHVNDMLYADAIKKKEVFIFPFDKEIHFRNERDLHYFVIVQTVLSRRDKKPL